MLVQCNLVEVLEDVGGGSAEVFCSNCGVSVGIVNAEELRHLVHHADWSVLCFKCEDIIPPQIVPIKSTKLTNLLRVFDIISIEKLPTSGWALWAREDFSVIMQLVPKRGWYLWRTTPDGRQGLHKVKMSYEEADQLRTVYGLVPFDTAIPLVL